MHKRTLLVLLGSLLFLCLTALGCSATRLVARGPGVTLTPTRTPRPTWTPASMAFQVATPTIDATRYPEAAATSQAAAGQVAGSTPQVFVPGGNGPIFVPVQPGSGAVQTVVVVIVTATPPPAPTFTPGPPTVPPPPTFTPGPPTATATATGTPLPPVTVKVKQDKTSVRQGPGTLYPVVTKLDAGTNVTVVGRNRTGDWWKICCVNGQDVWIADSAVEATGPIWVVAEVANIPPPPPTATRPPPTPTRTLTPTYSWPIKLQGTVQERPNAGNNYFRVDAVIYNGATPLYGYKLKIRKLSTGQEWLSDGSQTTWFWDVLQYPKDTTFINPSIDCPNTSKEGLLCLKSNVKWDSNSVQVPAGDDVWEVTATDGAGTPLSTPVRVTTSMTNPKWYYMVFQKQP